MKEFNTAGVCLPSKHYMVDLTERIREIRKLVDAGKYFTINRARQYGKTTTLKLLKKTLVQDYTVLSLDFQSLEQGVFETGGSFSQAMARIITDLHEFEGQEIPEEILAAFELLKTSDPKKIKMDELFRILKRWILSSELPFVLMIDEVDSAANNQVFLDFLAQLRDGYNHRDSDGIPAFQSVILAGVTDVKHLKVKIRDEDQSKVNSPWNIATDFIIDMSLSEEGIQGMLDEYEADHHTGMDTCEIAKLLHDYTSGYPFLVSRLCQLLDTRVSSVISDPATVWSRTGMDEAVKLLLSEDNTLFQSLTGKLTNNPELRAALRSILMEGERISYNAQQETISLMQMYGFIRNDRGTIRISSRIFETVLYNFFLSDEELRNNSFTREGDLAKNIFIQDRKLNVRLILEHFIKTYTEVFGPLEDRFKEKDGRELFLLYLKPIINDTGNYYIEAETRNQRRTDVIIDYLGRQYIIELKIWQGERYNEEGEQQLRDYLEYYSLTTGYMLSFNFNKKKQVGVERVEIDDKVIYEGIV